MICLTGDIHHTSLCTGNQKASDITEIQIAERYAAMLAEVGVKATYFVTGRSFAEEWEDLRPICENETIEIQGHGYNCFEPSLLHRVWKKLTGNYNGPYSYESRDVHRCIQIIEEKTGRRINAWRNHMYMHGPNSNRILAEHGIELCSDSVDATSLGPLPHASGVLQLPINVIPDHEHLYHAERTPAWVAWWQKRYNWSDSFGSRSYFVEEWTDLVLEQMAANEERGALSTLIIHPITLYLCDGFRSFQRILDYMEQRETLFVSEVIEKAKQGERVWYPSSSAPKTAPLS